MILPGNVGVQLGMFDDAAEALEEIESEDKTRKEVLGARLDLYMAAKKWDMAAGAASHLVKIEPRLPTVDQFGLRDTTLWEHRASGSGPLPST